MDYTQFLNDLYLQELNRAPDAVGMQGWSQALLSGQYTPDQVRDMFRQSTEYGKAATDQYGEQLSKYYQDELGRAPEQAGLEGWARALRSGQYNINQIPGLLDASDEGYVVNLYQDLLGRGMDDAAYGWVRGLQSGQYTRDQVRSMIENSDEYFNKKTDPLAGGSKTTDPGNPNIGYKSPQVGVVTAFTDYSPMKPMPDPRSQPFGFLYDTIEQRLGKNDPAILKSMLPIPTVDPLGPSQNYFKNGGGSLAGGGGGGSNMIGGLLDARNLVTGAYKSIFDRAPDDTGLNYWSQAVLGGMTQAQLLDALRGSAEYQAKQGAGTPAPAPASNDYGGGGA